MSGYSTPDFVAEIRAIFDAIPPPPRYDRVAVNDVCVFDSLERVKTIGSPSALAPSLLGLRVIVDVEVDPGTAELRLGDEVIERVRL